VVFADVFLDMFGRNEVLIGVCVPLASLRGKGESRRTDKDEGVLWWAALGGSAPGVGDGAAEPLAAAVALRTWALTCEAWRSVR
jgi:hypothetical protein